jgi:hypothetical protein
MADEQASGLSKASAKLAEVQAPFEIPADEHVDYLEREPEKVVPKKGSDGYETPSGYALAKVGEFKGEPGSEEAHIHGLKYLREKVMKRWGIGPG